MRRDPDSGVQAERNDIPDLPQRRHPIIYFVGIVGFLMFAYGGFMTQKLLDPAAFPIKKIAVEGEFHHLTPDHVQHIVSSAVDGGFFVVNVTNVRERILDEPWIFEATVQRVWPDTIRVGIREQQPVARWGEYALLNEYADIFVPDVGALPDDLVVLDGPIGTEAELLSRYLAVKPRFAALNLKIERINLSDRRAWKFKLADGATIIIGRHDVGPRLVRFDHIFEKILSKNWERIDLVDLRYANGFAIKEKAALIGNG